MNVPTKQVPEEHPISAEVEALTRALAEPFGLTEVRFKPAVVSGNRALALAYVDARVIQDRLDDVLGVGGWQDDYECLPDGSVVCRLRLRLGDEWVTKVDVGGPSEQPDGGDRLKAAFSDALKRAAVKFGIGRYLYRLQAQWVDYDPQRRQFVRPPMLPASALPTPKTEEPLSRTKRPELLPSQPALPYGLKEQKMPPKPAKPAAPPASPRPAASASPHALPANGEELQRRLYDYDARLASQGLCRPGDLVKHVVQAGVKAGYESDLAAWSGPAIGLAVEETKGFETQVRRPAEGRKEVA